MIVLPTGSTRAKSSSRTSEPMTATIDRCWFSVSLKKRPSSMSRFESSATFAVTPAIWTSGWRRLPALTDFVAPERAPTIAAVLASFSYCSRSCLETRLRLSASRNCSWLVMIPKRSIV